MTYTTRVGSKVARGYPLLTAYYLTLTAYCYCLLLTISHWLPSTDVLLTTYFWLLTTQYSLLATHYLRPITCWAGVPVTSAFSGELESGPKCTHPEDLTCSRMGLHGFERPGDQRLSFQMKTLIGFDAGFGAVNSTENTLSCWRWQTLQLYILQNNSKSTCTL